MNVGNIVQYGAPYRLHHSNYGWINSDLIGFKYRMKKIEAEADTTYNDFYMFTIFRLAKPAFFRYNENFTVGT